MSQKTPGQQIFEMLFREYPVKWDELSESSKLEAEQIADAIRQPLVDRITELVKENERLNTSLEQALKRGRNRLNAKNIRPE